MELPYTPATAMISYKGRIMIAAELQQLSRQHCYVVHVRARHINETAQD